MIWLTVTKHVCHHGYVPLVINTFRFFPHSWLITEFATRIAQRVPLVEQELFTLLEHPSSFWIRVTRSSVLRVMLCRLLFVLLSFLLLAIVLSIFPWFTVFDYPFGIFNRFLPFFHYKLTLTIWQCAPILFIWCKA
jgi:hypothetical protein